MQFQFIRATENDRPYLLALRYLTMVAHLEKSGQFLSESEQEAWLNDAYECFHLIVYQDEPVGALKYRVLDNCLEIMQLQIHPNFQGRGMGRKVMEQVLKETKCQTAELSVLKENPALKLYQRLGFFITGEDEYEFYMRKQIV